MIITEGNSLGSSCAVGHARMCKSAIAKTSKFCRIGEPKQCIKAKH